MPSQKKFFKNFLSAISTAIGSLTAICGLMIIIAWQNEITSLKTFGLGEIPIKANAGACFLLSGLALVLIQFSHLLPRLVSRLFSLIVIAIGFLSIVEIVFTVNLGIDEILFRKLFLSGAVTGPIRMSLNGAICQMLIAMALFSLSSKNIRFNYFHEFCIVLAFSISIVGLFGFIFGLAQFSETTGYTNMAILAALLFVLMCFGIIVTLYSKVPLKIEIDQRLFAVIIFASTLLIFVSLLSGNGYISVRQTSERADHSQRIKNYLNLLLSDILDVETGVRGYLISSDEDYVTSLSKAKEDLSVSMHELKELLRGNQLQQLRLDKLNQLVLERVEYAELIKSVIQSEGKKAGIALFQTKKGKLLTDNIRLLITKMKDDENQHVKLRNESEIQNSSDAQLIIFLNLIIELFLIALIFIVIRRNINQRNNVLIEFRKLNEDLELKVKERTLTLTQSEEKYRYMFANNPQPMWIYDVETLSFLEVNNAAIHHYSYSREEFLSMTLKDIRPSEDIELLLKVTSSEQNNYMTKEEWRHLKKNGEIIYVEIISHIVTFNNRKARHVMVTDITERKKTDQKIRDSEEKFRSLFKKSPFGIAYHEMIFDDSGKPIDYRFLEVNEAFINIIGIDPTGKKVTEAFPGIEKSSFDWIGTYGHVAITGEQIRFEQFFESTNRYYDCVAFRSEKNQYAVVFLDVTERRTAEEEISRLNERILTATQSAQLGIWDWDVLNNDLVWDDQMYKLYGLNKESFSGAYEAWLNGLHPDDREYSEKESGNALTGEKDYDTEFRVVWPDGSIHFLKTRGEVIRDENGKPERMIGINYDITLQKHAEEEINNLTIDLEKRVADRTSQLEAANKELESFSYSVSHDLMAPLRHIRGFVDILTNEYYHQLPEEARRYLHTIAAASQNMGTLISDLLSFSKAGRVEMKKSLVSMGKIVDEVISLCRPSLTERKIEWDLSPLPDVNGDFNLLHNVWVNLIDNAVKYTRLKDNTVIRIGYEEKNNEIIFCVSDNGVGFDMKYAQKLFGVFQRLHSVTEFEGTGIGLANVQRIISRHGGRTWAEAEPDQGATFYFSIPK